jgi:tetratricopeptide (TPR) repeat protein
MNSPQECSNSSEVGIQEPWLRQSYLVGHPLEQRDDYAGALVIYNRVLERDPEDVHVLLLKGRALLNLEREEEARRIFRLVVEYAERALQEDPANTRMWVYKGDSLYMLAMDDAALDAYNWAIRLAPEDPDIFYRRGCVLWEMQRYEEALQDANKAIALDSSQPRFFLAKSTTLSYMNREEESRQAYMHYQRLVNMRKSA